MPEKGAPKSPAGTEGCARKNAHALTSPGGDNICLYGSFKVFLGLALSFSNVLIDVSHNPGNPRGAQKQDTAPVVFGVCPAQKADWRFKSPGATF